MNPTNENSRSCRITSFRLQYFTYQTRKICKGAVLVLIWNFVSFTVVEYPTHKSDSFGLLIFLLCGLSFPIIGCLSDIYIGRYKVIRYSVWILFFTLIIANISLVIKLYVWDSKILEIIEFIRGTATSLGLAGVLANTMQFGIDQLIDFGSTSITSYISWYFWTVSLASILVAVSQNCFCGTYNSSTSFFLLPLLYAIAIICDFLMSKWLIVEPVTSNPFKLIYQVLRYAMKNKYPRLRSAFTYWEDKPYSRIDLGKTKYGGPFTTEQVEDVKTFFRLLPAIAFFSLLIGEIFVLQVPYLNTDNNLNVLKSCSETSTKAYIIKCYKDTAIQYSLWEIIFIFVPIFEFVLYPLLFKCKCCIEIGILKKLYIGTLLVFMVELSLLTLETISTLSTTDHNATCSFALKRDNLMDEEYFIHNKWLLAIKLVMGVAVYILGTSTLEFVCAQSPYSMKGLLIGMIYFLGIIAISLSGGFMKVFQILTKTSGERCGIWFYLTNICLTFIIACILVIMIKFYIFRKRDETLSNDQMFAVDYFSKYLSSKTSKDPNSQ